MAGFIESLLRRARLPQRGVTAFVSWDKMQQIAIIIDASEKFSKQEIDQWIKNCGKHVEVIYLETRSKTPTYADWHCMTSKQKNMAGLPTRDALKSSHELKVQAVINTTPEENVFASWISLAIQTGFRCGTGHGVENPELVIDRGNHNLLQHLRQTESYLKMIRSTL